MIVSVGIHSGGSVKKRRARWRICMQEARHNQEQLNAQIAQGSSPIYYGWIIVATCFVIIALVSPIISSFSVFYPAVLQDFHWSRGSTAIALSLHLVLGGIASPFAGGLIDKYGPRLVMP